MCIPPEDERMGVFIFYKAGAFAQKELIWHTKKLWMNDWNGYGTHFLT
jgi:hypothetical protein